MISLLLLTCPVALAEPTAITLESRIQFLDHLVDPNLELQEAIDITREFPRFGSHEEWEEALNELLKRKPKIKSQIEIGAQARERFAKESRSAHDALLKAIPLTTEIAQQLLESYQSLFTSSQQSRSRPYWEALSLAEGDVSEIPQDVNPNGILANFKSQELNRALKRRTWETPKPGTVKITPEILEQWKHEQRKNILQTYEETLKRLVQFELSGKQLAIGPTEAENKISVTFPNSDFAKISLDDLLQKPVRLSPGSALLYIDDGKQTQVFSIQDNSLHYRKVHFIQPCINGVGGCWDRPIAKAVGEDIAKILIKWNLSRLNALLDTLDGMRSPVLDPSVVATLKRESSNLRSAVPDNMETVLSNYFPNLLGKFGEMLNHMVWANPHETFWKKLYDTKASYFSPKPPTGKEVLHQDRTLFLKRVIPPVFRSLSAVALIGLSLEAIPFFQSMQNDSAFPTLHEIFTPSFKTSELPPTPSNTNNSPVTVWKVVPRNHSRDSESLPTQFTFTHVADPDAGGWRRLLLSNEPEVASFELKSQLPQRLSTNGEIALLRPNGHDLESVQVQLPYGETVNSARYQILQAPSKDLKLRFLGPMPSSEIYINASYRPSIELATPDRNFIEAHFYNLDRNKINAIAKQMEDAGFVSIPKSLYQLTEGNRHISIFDVENVFAENSYYSHIPLHSPKVNERNPFSFSSQALNESGDLCGDCDVTNATLKTFLKEYFKNTPAISVRFRHLFQRSNDSDELQTPTHAQLIVGPNDNFSAGVVLDSTPIRNDPRDKGLAEVIAELIKSWNRLLYYPARNQSKHPRFAQTMALGTGPEPHDEPLEERSKEVSSQDLSFKHTEAITALKRWLREKSGSPTSGNAIYPHHRLFHIARALEDFISGKLNKTAFREQLLMKIPSDTSELTGLPTEELFKTLRNRLMDLSRKSRSLFQRNPQFAKEYPFAGSSEYESQLLKLCDVLLSVYQNEISLRNDSEENTPSKKHSCETVFLLSKGVTLP